MRGEMSAEKAYLQRYLKARETMASMARTLERLREAAGVSAVRYDVDKVQGGQSEGMAGIMAQVIDVESQLQRMQESAAAIAAEIIDSVLWINDEQYRDILLLRYIHGYTWEQIAEAKHYSVRYVYKIHGRALAAFRSARSKRTC